MSARDKCEIIKVGTIEFVQVPDTDDNELRNLASHGVKLDGWIFGRWADMRGTGKENYAWDLWDNDDDGPWIFGWPLKELMAARDNPSEFTR